MSSRWWVASLCASVCLASFQVRAEVGADQAAELEALRQRVKALEEHLSVDALPPATAAEAPDVAQSNDRIQFNGDARYRAENGELDGVHNDRQRVRARIGAMATVSERLSTGFRLSTGEGDPRSAHLTFSGGYSRRSVGVDLAYLKWQALPEIAVSAGKVIYPNWQPAQSVFIGGDANPEGWSAAYHDQSGWFANAHDFWLQTRGDSGDSRQSGLQIGFGSDAKAPASLTIAAAYTDFVNVRGEKPFLDGVNSYGNSIDASGALAQDQYRRALLGAHVARLSGLAHVLHAPGAQYVRFRRRHRIFRRSVREQRALQTLASWISVCPHRKGCAVWPVDGRRLRWRQHRFARSRFTHRLPSGRTLEQLAVVPEKQSRYLIRVAAPVRFDPARYRFHLLEHQPLAPSAGSHAESAGSP